MNKPKYNMNGVHIRKLGTGLFSPVDLTFSIKAEDIGNEIGETITYKLNTG